MNTYSSSRLSSLCYAIRGLKQAVLTEPNIRIELWLLLAAVTAGWLLQIDSICWLAIVLCAAAVLGLELLNTAVEHLCNLVSPGYHPQVKIIKDMSAAAVLVAAACSVVVAALIFIPRFYTVIQNLS